MLAPSHVIIGVVSVAITTEYLGPTIVWPLGYSWAILGSLLPDIDHKKSRLGRIINPLIILVIYFLLLSLYPEADFTLNSSWAKGAAHIHSFFSPHQVITFVTVLTAAFVCQVWAGHRTITHSFFICIILLWNLNNATDGRMFAFSIAYISHIVLDLFSPDGIQLFYPYGKRLSLKPRIPVGSFLEGLIVVAVTVFMYLLSEEGRPWRRLIFR